MDREQTILKVATTGVAEDLDLEHGNNENLFFTQETVKNVFLNIQHSRIAFKLKDFQC